MKTLRTSVVAGLILTGAAAAALAWNIQRHRAASSTGDGRSTVAVSAFRATGDESNPWAGSGLAQEVTQALNALPRISARQSVMRPSNEVEPGTAALTAMGRRERASYALGGTIRRLGARSEIGVELVRVRDGSTVWTGTFWRQPDDLNSFSSDLAVAVDAAIRLDEKNSVTARGRKE